MSASSRHVVLFGIAFVVVAMCGPLSVGAHAETTGLRDCPECPEMVEIPAGSFVMGSPPTGGLYHSWVEVPQRTVRVPGFALGKYEVTFDEWDACVAARGCSIRAADGGWGRGRRPVVLVSWEDAKQYVTWLSQRTGKRYRLPSEAEWEYAARAGTSTHFWWGDAPGRNRANCASCGSQWDAKQTAPVGSFPPNPFGLHDMHGNVKEWVEDCWVTNSYYGAPVDGSPWVTGCSVRGALGQLQMIRGGSYNVNPQDMRSASRAAEYAAERGNSHVGFRVARSP